jgi:dimethylamine--corrinoid protein Co-methyltransferase
MESAHTQASGMGGMRTAGDLVARMQMTRRMRTREAKQYVADRLGCTCRDLSDPIAMEQIRIERGLGTLPFTSAVHPGHPGMIEAKFNIAKTLDIPINCVELFKDHVGLTEGEKRSAR